MKAIILAAGRGSRMGRLTNTQPKCLTELSDRTLLDWQIAALTDGGVDEIIIVGGYQSNALQNKTACLIENHRWAETDMVASLSFADEHLRKDVALVSYSDIVYHPECVRALCETDGDIAIAYDELWQELWRDRFDDPLEDAETFRVAKNRVTEIGQRAVSVSEIQGQYMGLLKITLAGWLQIEGLLANIGPTSRDRLDCTSLLNRLIEKGIPVAGCPTQGRWCEVDNEKDLQLYTERLAKVDRGEDRWAHDWRWA